MLHTNENNSNPVCFSAKRPPSFGELNARNQGFWEEPNNLAVARMSNSVILRTAIEDLESEALRQLPVYFRKSLEKALEDAARTKERCDEQPKRQFQSEFSRKGGRALKADALQQFIMDKVRYRPKITEPELLELLKANRRIFQMNAEEIYFDKPNGACPASTILSPRIDSSKLLLRGGWLPH